MENLYEILNKIKPDVNFREEKNLVEDGILDSLEIVQILDSIEECFGKEIPPEFIDPDNFASVEKIWEMINKI